MCGASFFIHLPHPHPPHLGTMIGGLTAGRVLIAMGAVNGAALAVSVALRFSADRPQFASAADPNGPPVPILSYVTHQRRLVPALASTLAYHAAVGKLKQLYAKPGASPKEVHILSSCVKAGATWARRDAQTAAREACGGMGFLSANRIGPYKNDQDVDVTFEGDNTVLMQQIAKTLVGDATRGGKAAPAPAPPPPPPGDFTDPTYLLTVARFREACLVAKLAGATVTTATAAGGGAKGASAAAAAYDAGMDIAVDIGCARADIESISSLMAAADAAPPAARRHMKLAAAAHAAARTEASAAFHLAAGSLRGAAGAEALRTAANSIYAELCVNGGAPALALADALGVPDHLLAAPAAFDWRAIGA